LERASRAFSQRNSGGKSPRNGRERRSQFHATIRGLIPVTDKKMAEGGGDGARGRWNALAEHSRQRRPKGVEGTVRFRTSFHNVVYDVFRARAWKETDSDVDWDVCWADTGALRQAAPPLLLTPHLIHRASCTVHRAPYSLPSHVSTGRSVAGTRSTCHLPHGARSTCHLPTTTPCPLRVDPREFRQHPAERAPANKPLPQPL
jgi:hypothetical protein